MDFNDLVRQSDVENQEQIVGLAILFQEKVRGVNPVPRSLIIQTIEDSKVSVPTGNISEYLRRLDQKNHVVRKDGDYRLSLDGEPFFAKLAGMESLGETLRHDEFIEVDDDDDFYSTLIGDINRAYRSGLDDAVLILSRKLLENLVLDLLRLRYGLDSDSIALFYNVDVGRLLPFSRLLENLEDNLEDFEYYSDRLDDGMIRNIRELKGRGDASAHSIEINVSEEYLEEFREELQPVLEVLFYVKQEIRASQPP